MTTQNLEDNFHDQQNCANPGTEDGTARRVSASKTSQANGGDSGFTNRMEIAARMAGNATRLSAATGISRRAIGDYLAGKAEPSRPRLVAIAKAAGVSVQWLAVGDTPPCPPKPLSVDSDVIEDAIKSVEEYLDERQQTLSAATRAKIVITLCALAFEQDERGIAGMQGTLNDLLPPFGTDPNGSPVNANSLPTERPRIQSHTPSSEDLTCGRMP